MDAPTDTQLMAALEKDEAYCVEHVLASGEAGSTEVVSRPGAEHLGEGPLVRKRVKRDVANVEVFSRLSSAADKHLPLIIFSASGGARMQEGIFSLMQMAKTSAALERFNRSGGLYISVLTHPTTGGVTASFASLGDITLAEPGALIGFAGPRVIEQTIGEKLPGGFQRSEFQLEHGFVDQVVPRTELKEVLTRILQLHTQGRKHR